MFICIAKKSVRSKAAAHSCWADCITLSRRCFAAEREFWLGSFLSPVWVGVWQRCLADSGFRQIFYSGFWIPEPTSNGLLACRQLQLFFPGLKKRSIKDAVMKTLLRTCSNAKFIFWGNSKFESVQIEHGKFDTKQIFTRLKLTIEQSVHKLN